MTITFENDNDVIIYALEKILSFSKKHQYLFVAQCILWISTVIGLERGLTINIDNLERRQVLRMGSSENNSVNIDYDQSTVSAEDLSEAETVRRVISDNEGSHSTNSTPSKQGQILKESRQELRKSQRLRDLAVLNLTRKLHSEKKISKTTQKDTVQFPKTEGISKEEITRRKKSGECLHCAWPGDIKGSHRVMGCIQLIRLEKGTAI